MKIRGACVIVAIVFVALGLASTLRAEAQTDSKLKSLTLGLVFHGPPEPVVKRFRPFVEYLGRKVVPGRKAKSVVTVAPTVAQLTKLLEQKRVDFYLESPYPTYLINRSSHATILLRRWKGGVSDYRSLIVTNKASRIARLEDLRGKIVAFEDAGSTSGYFLPKLLLFKRGFSVVEKAALEVKVPEAEIGYIFAATEKNIVNLIVQEKVAAGAISSDDYDGLDEKTKASLSILAESESLPRHLLSVHRKLSKPVVMSLKETLLGMHRDSEGLRILGQTDDTTKFDTLPGGEVTFRRTVMELYRPRGGN